MKTTQRTAEEQRLHALILGRIEGAQRGRVEVGEALAVVRGDPVGGAAPALRFSGDEPDHPVRRDGDSADVDRVAFDRPSGRLLLFSEHIDDPRFGIRSVPTALERKGDFSQSFTTNQGTRFPIR